jgi:hypothetical protein
MSSAVLRIAGFDACAPKVVTDFSRADIDDDRD